MRTVICHFFNEEYLLPWWLKHHRGIFNHGIMINHGSTDRSIEIIRDLAPSWQLVNSTLTHFDPFLTDFEVMQYERHVPGWKIALNVTEFLMTTMPLPLIEKKITEMELKGFSLSGFIMVDATPNTSYDKAIPLPLQCTHGIDDNIVLDKTERINMGLPHKAYRNRFYHCDELGRYMPGRHQSYHPHSNVRLCEAMVFYFANAPWNDEMKRRKLQIRSKIKTDEISHDWGLNHLQSLDFYQEEFLKLQAHSMDLRTRAYAGPAIEASCLY